MTLYHLIMLSTKYIVIIPAYNEESTIVDCLDHVLEASRRTPGFSLEKIIVCVNGCTDKTEELARNWNKGPIKVIESAPGYIKAVNRLMRYAKKHYPDKLMIKTDADGMVDPNAFSILFDQLAKHQNLIIVGGHPMPVKSSSKNPYRQLMSRILSVRSRTPEAEITTTDTAKFHPYAAIDPIPELNGRETKLKIYFHGRLWVARTPRSIPTLPSEVIGDDVYLPGWLLENHGPSSMRLDYRAKVSFYPNDSLVRHWKVYRRIYEDRNIVYSLKGFGEYARACPLKLDWSYILRTSPPNEKLYFILYTLIVSVEKLSYRFSAYNSSYWQYNKKET